MRITVLCADLGVRVPGDKGASVHLLSITRAFIDAGHEVLLVGVAGRDPAPPDVPAVLFPHPGRATGLRREMRKLHFNASLPMRVGEAIRAFGPDVVYERLALFGTAGAAVARALDVPHVLEVNALLAREESDWRGLHMGKLARRLEEQVLRSATLRVAVSAEVAADIRQVAPDPPLEVVPNGLDADRFRSLPSRAAAREAHGIDRDAVVLGFVGALRPWHGVEYAIDALRELPADTTLVVAGDGPIRADLEERARAQGVSDRVRFLGQLPHSEIPGVLATFDIALAPYPALERFSFSPLKAYEYIGAGLPVVASDVGQLREIVTEEAGLLVEPSNPTAIAEACTRIRRQSDSWVARSQAARAHVLATHGWTGRANDIIAALEEVSPHAAVA